MMHNLEAKPIPDPQAPNAHEPISPFDKSTQLQFSEATDSLIFDLGRLFEGAEDTMDGVAIQLVIPGPARQTLFARLSEWRKDALHSISKDFEFGLSMGSDGFPLASLSNSALVFSKVENVIRRYELALSLFSIAKNLNDRLKKDRFSCERIKERILSLQRQIETLEAEFSHMSTSPENGGDKKNPFRLETVFDSITHKRDESEKNITTLGEKSKDLESLEADLKAVVDKIESLCTDFDSTLPVSIEAFPEIQHALGRAKVAPAEPFADRVSEVLRNSRKLKPATHRKDSVTTDRQDNALADHHKAQMQIKALRAKIAFFLFSSVLTLPIPILASAFLKRTQPSEASALQCVQAKPENNEAFGKIKKRVLELAQKENLAKEFTFPNDSSLETLIEKTNNKQELDLVAQFLTGCIGVKAKPDPIKIPFKLTSTYEEMLKIIYGFGDNAEFTLFFAKGSSTFNPLSGLEDDVTDF